jgi:hypothetical protein
MPIDRQGRLENTFPKVDLRLIIVGDRTMPHQQYQSIIDAAVHCACECEHCAQVCLGDMPDCARVCQDCAQLCWTIASFISRSSRFIPQVVRSCIEVCEACAAECEKHSDNPHCQKCAEACRQAVAQYQKVANLAGVA